MQHIPPRQPKPIDSRPFQMSHGSITICHDQHRSHCFLFDRGFLQGRSLSAPAQV
jgi:hypothetical protein